MSNIKVYSNLIFRILGITFVKVISLSLCIYGFLTKNIWLGIGGLFIFDITPSFILNTWRNMKIINNDSINKEIIKK